MKLNAAKVEQVFNLFIIIKNHRLKTCATLLAAAAVAWLPVAASSAEVILRTASATGDNPLQAGKTAAESLKKALAGAEPQVVILADCFEDKENKEQVLKGVASVLGAEKIVGGSFYGMFTREGVAKQDAVALLAIAGDSVKVRAACEENMGAAGLTLEKDKEKLTGALNAAGKRLAGKLGGVSAGSLMILISDAHSPKNQLLLDGVQSVVGTSLPITGASVNKNAGQNWIYFHGKLHTDSAVAVLISGPFKSAFTGRQAKDNDLVIATARDASAEALKKLGKPPFAVLAFDCAGRMGKLKNLPDELAAMQSTIGKDMVLFGCYGAGEYGPPDASDSEGKTYSCGRGWHVMITALGQ